MISLSVNPSNQDPASGAGVSETGDTHIVSNLADAESLVPSLSPPIIAQLAKPTN